MTKRVLILVVVIFVGATLFAWYRDNSKQSQMDISEMTRLVTAACDYTDTLLGDSLAGLGVTDYRVGDVQTHIQFTHSYRFQVVYVVEVEGGSALRYAFVVEMQDGEPHLYSEGLE